MQRSPLILLASKRKIDFHTAKKHTLQNSIVIEENTEREKERGKKEFKDFKGQHFLRRGGKMLHSFVFESYEVFTVMKYFIRSVMY